VAKFTTEYSKLCKVGVMFVTFVRSLALVCKREFRVVFAMAMRDAFVLMCAGPGVAQAVTKHVLKANRRFFLTLLSCQKGNGCVCLFAYVFMHVIPRQQ
jgi:hypothetical protein